VPLLRLGRAVAEAGEHRVPRRAAEHALGRGEDALEVDRAVRRGLGRVRHDDLAEVGLGPDRARRHHPELEEVLEVGELVEARELVDVVDGQLDAVAPRDVEELTGPHGSLEVDVQLDLRRDDRHGTPGCASSDVVRSPRSRRNGPVALRAARTGTLRHQERRAERVRPDNADPARLVGSRPDDVTSVTVGARWTPSNAAPRACC
jgi:hypothetical protein